MDRRVTLQRKTEAQDSFGEAIETWADIATVWAEVTVFSGQERWAAQQVIAEADTRFRIRYMPGLTPLDRIMYDGKAYDVYAVIEAGRREGHEILAGVRAE